MRLLVATTLFPNAVEPHHGVFVRTRLLRYLARHGGTASVVAPVPLAPPVGPRRWTAFRDVPAHERQHGLAVDHPRFVAPPGFGDRWRAALLARGLQRALLARARQQPPDVLDAHCAWPDGVAALAVRARLERALGRRLPLVVTCRGTDLNLAPSLPGVRAQLADLFARADHVVTVAEALRDVALGIGADPARTTTLRNGVDTATFAPGDRAAARRALRLPATGPLVLSVGHLVPRKGPLLLLSAFARVHGRDPHAHLVLVGKGEQEAALRDAARALGLPERVHLPGAVPPEALPDWYRAADVSVLASSREGWPNVVLESLACGTPVVATRVWGTPEILQGCAAGLLVEPSVDGLAAGLAAAAGLDASAARPWAERHGWEPTLDGLHAVFEAVTAGRTRGAAAAGARA